MKLKLALMGRRPGFCLSAPLGLLLASVALDEDESKCGNSAFQRKKWRDTTMVQNVAKARRMRLKAALTRRKKAAPTR